MMVVETDRLLIRHWTEEPADLSRIFDIYSRWEVARWLGVRPRVLAGQAEAVAVVRRWNAPIDGDSGGRYGRWAVQVRETGRVAGSVLLKPLPGVDDLPTGDIEVGWHLHPDSWRLGYATEAARGVIDRAFAAGLAEVYAVVKPGNEASIAVTRRLGMTPLGRRTDWYGGVEVEAFRLCPDPGRAGAGGRDREE